MRLLGHQVVIKLSLTSYSCGDRLNVEQINNVLFAGADEPNYEGSDIEDAPTEEELSSDSSDGMHQSRPSVDWAGRFGHPKMQK